MTGVTRLLVTTYQLKPERMAQWRQIQAHEVVPALKQAGVPGRTIYRTVIGNASEMMEVVVLPSFAAFDRPSPLEQVLGADDASALQARLDECVLSVTRHIEHRQDEFHINPGDAGVLFTSWYRPSPGRSRDYLSFIRAEMWPAVQRARAVDNISGFSVTVSDKGGETGLYTLNMFYSDFASLDGPPPVAFILGPKGTAEFIAKGAGLITPLGQAVRVRESTLSF
ncbi:MAG: hypothetical protein H6978_00985 [Gammaproteobacteria bacterium]|nr:hypothetical protein [Gammaproteobacteria bacterium]